MKIEGLEVKETEKSETSKTKKRKKEKVVKSRWHNMWKTLGFLLIVGIILSIVSVICVPSDLLKEQYVLYEEEPEGTIDIAFVGSSATYRYYDVMAIWDEYNITSMGYYVASMPFDYLITMLELVQEHQSPEIYVIDLRHILLDEYKQQYYSSYETEKQQTAVRNALNLLPNSWTKWSEILESKYLFDGEYLLFADILYNHDNFLDGVVSLVENGFTIDAMDYKGNYLSFITSDVSEDYVDFSEVEEHEDYTLTEHTVERMTELFEYCDANDINAYFTITPYAQQKCVTDLDIRREFGELIESYGYPYRDFRSEFEEIGMDPATDFADYNHANAWGAEKYTLYAMEYFLEAYEFEADYDEEVIEDWDSTYEEWVVYKAAQ